MFAFFKNAGSALVACLAVALTASAGSPPCVAPPNWRGSGTGTTTPDGAVDVDRFIGRSTHLGRFTGLGFHATDPTTFAFEGEATWTAANGATLEVTYVGQIFPSGDPDFPYGFSAQLRAVGGTGRLAHARGHAVMTGAFSGVPGEFYFDFVGTLR